MARIDGSYAYLGGAADVLWTMRQDGVIEGWDANTLAHLTTIGTRPDDCPGCYRVFSFDGSGAFSFSDGTFAVWTPQRGPTRYGSPGGERILALSLSADKTRAIVARRDGRYEFWDLGSGGVARVVDAWVGRTQIADRGSSVVAVTDVGGGHLVVAELAACDGCLLREIVVDGDAWLTTFSVAGDAEHLMAYRRPSPTNPDQSVRVQRWDISSGAVLGSLRVAPEDLRRAPIIPIYYSHALVAHDATLSLVSLADPDQTVWSLPLDPSTRLHTLGLGWNRLALIEPLRVVIWDVPPNPAY